MNKYNPDIHHRRSIRLHGYDYSQEGLYFVTICTQHRECLFGEIADGEMRLNEIGRMVEKCWLAIPQHYPDTTLHNHIVMPNHFHGIIEITKSFDGGNVNNGIVGAGFARPMNNTPNNDGNNNEAGFARPEQCPMNNTDNNMSGVDTNGAGICNDNGAGEPRPYVPTLGNMIAYFKYQSTKQINLPTKLWQRNYHEHIIRDHADYARIDDYITNNPANWDIDRFHL